MSMATELRKLCLFGIDAGEHHDLDVADFKPQQIAIPAYVFDFHG
jgi:hypothetical protein